jgi:hypothetical protein
MLIQQVHCGQTLLTKAAKILTVWMAIELDHSS